MSSQNVKKISVRLAKMNERELKIHTPFIKLDSAVKLADITGSGGAAKMLIENGEIRVNGEKCFTRGKKLYPGDNFEYELERRTIVSEDDNKEN